MKRSRRPGAYLVERLATRLLQGMEKGALSTEQRIEAVIHRAALIGAGCNLVPVPLFCGSSHAVVQAALTQAIARLLDAPCSVEDIQQMAGLVGRKRLVPRGRLAILRFGVPVAGPVLALSSIYAWNYGVGKMAERFYALKKDGRPIDRETLEEAFEQGRKAGMARAERKGADELVREARTEEESQAVPEAVEANAEQTPAGTSSASDVPSLDLFRFPEKERQTATESPQTRGRVVKEKPIKSPRAPQQPPRQGASRPVTPTKETDRVAPSLLRPDVRTTETEAVPELEAAAADRGSSPVFEPSVPRRKSRGSKSRSAERRRRGTRTAVSWSDKVHSSGAPVPEKQGPAVVAKPAEEGRKDAASPASREPAPSLDAPPSAHSGDGDLAGLEKAPANVGVTQRPTPAALGTAAGVETEPEVGDVAERAMATGRREDIDALFPGLKEKKSVEEPKPTFTFNLDKVRSGTQSGSSKVEEVKILSESEKSKKDSEPAPVEAVQTPADTTKTKEETRPEAKKGSSPEAPEDITVEKLEQREDKSVRNFPDPFAEAGSSNGRGGRDRGRPARSRSHRDRDFRERDSGRARRIPRFSNSRDREGIRRPERRHVESVAVPTDVSTFESLAVAGGSKLSLEERREALRQLLEKRERRKQAERAAKAEALSTAALEDEAAHENMAGTDTSGDATLDEPVVGADRKGLTEGENENVEAVPETEPTPESAKSSGAAAAEEGTDVPKEKKSSRSSRRRRRNRKPKAKQDAGTVEAPAKDPEEPAKSPEESNELAGEPAQEPEVPAKEGAEPENGPEESTEVPEEPPKSPEDPSKPTEEAVVEPAKKPEEPSTRAVEAKEPVGEPAQEPEQPAKEGPEPEKGPEESTEVLEEPPKSPEEPSKAVKEPVAEPAMEPKEPAKNPEIREAEAGGRASGRKPERSSRKRKRSRKPKAKDEEASQSEPSADTSDGKGDGLHEGEQLALVPEVGESAPSRRGRTSKRASSARSRKGSGPEAGEASEKKSTGKKRTSRRTSRKKAEPTDTSKTVGDVAATEKKASGRGGRSSRSSASKTEPDKTD